LLLSREEEKMWNGEYGPAVEKAIRVVVRVGESLGATQLVKVSHVHASGISYKNVGEPGRLFIKHLASMGARVSVFSTMNPAGMDLECWTQMGVPQEFAQAQREIVESLVKMGFHHVPTCTPYLIRRPSLGERLAWGESSAVGMANTYYGATTNREGGPLALMSAIVGRTYYAGLHLKENRVPRVRIVLDERVRRGLGDPGVAGALGYVVGEIVGDTVPLLEGARSMNFDSIRAYVAAAGATGNIALTVIEGITPGWRELLKMSDSMERVQVEWSDITRVFEQARAESPDLVFVGCPHATVSEMKMLLEVLEGCKRVRSDIEIWVSTSRNVYLEAKEIGLIERLARFGVIVVRDTCPMVSPVTARFRRVVTVSAKSLFYLPRTNGVETSLVPFNMLGEVLCGEGG